MEKTIPPRMKIYGFLCALLLCLSWVPALAQDCPDLKREDFEISVLPPNSECNIPGQITVRYNKNVVGDENLRYEVRIGESGTPQTYEPLSARTPVKIDLPVDMTGGNIYVTVFIRCGDEEKTTSLLLSAYPKKSEECTLELSSVAAGSAVGSSGSIKAKIDGPAGIDEAVFYLYNDADPNTVISKLKTTRPYDGVTFFNLAKGEYTVKATVKPTCDPASPPANWNTDHFDLTARTTIKPFDIIATAIPARGTCTGGIKVEASKVNGVQHIEYRLTTLAQPTVALETVTVDFPKFTHTFVGLVPNDYIVFATEKTSNGEIREEIKVKNDVPEFTVEVLHGSTVAVNEGEVNIVLPNPSQNCPAKISINRVDGGSFTPVLKDNVTDQVTLISGLPVGSYQASVEWGGEVRTSDFDIPTTLIPSLSAQVSPAGNLCEPSGSVKWKIAGKNRYYPLKISIKKKKDNTLIREFDIPASQRAFETKNLYPGEYYLTARYEKGNIESNTDFVINTVQSLDETLSFDFSNASTEFCAKEATLRIPVKYEGGGGIEAAPTLQAFLNGATFEIYNDATGEVLHSGRFPTLKGNSTSYIETPKLGTKLRIVPRCGYPVQTYSITVNDLFKFAPELIFRGCGNTGTDVNLRVLDSNGQAVPNITYKVKKKNSTEYLAEISLAENQKEANIAAMLPGEYTVEWYPNCQPTQVHIDDLVVDDKVKEKSRIVKPASCGENGSVTISLNEFRNIREWRNELIRKSDMQLLRVYGTPSATKEMDPDLRTALGVAQVSFDRLPAGDYIIKVTPVVECGEIKQGVFEVTIPSSTLSVHDIPQYQASSVTPYKNDGRAVYKVNAPLDYVKWKALDVVTGKVINQGEVFANKKVPSSGYDFVADNLPHIYKMEFETPCGKFVRVDKLPLKDDQNLFKLDVTPVSVSSKCPKQSYAIVRAELSATENGSGSKIVLSKLKDGSQNDYEPSDEVTNPTSVIKEHTFAGLEPGKYRVDYFYNGLTSTKDFVILDAVKPTLNIQTVDFSPKGKGAIYVSVGSVEKNVNMQVVVKEITADGERELLNTVVPASTPYRLVVNSSNPLGSSTYDIQATIQGGCNDGEKVGGRAIVNEAKQLAFDAIPSIMNCKNDGVITLKVSESFHDVDQVHYDLTRLSEIPYVSEAETTKPAESKQFVGLLAGDYLIKARATVFRDKNGEPQVFDAERRVTLTTNYGEGLYATARPDYMLPTRHECPNGRIGLGIENGSGNYRVFLKSTPDGKLASEREIFTDSRGSEGHNKLWGQGLKPGNYSLIVRDGCMETEIPNVEILEIPNSPRVQTMQWREYLKLDTRALKAPNENRDSVEYSFFFDNSQFPENFRADAYKSFELQVVAKGAEPDNNQWKSNWGFFGNDPSKPYIQNYSKRFNNCDGVDVLMRVKGCPETVTRIPMNLNISDAFVGYWEELKCNTVQWAFYRGDIGHRYRIKVVRTEDDHVMYDKEVTFNSHQDYLTRDPELEFPAEKAYRFEMTPLDYCGEPIGPYAINDLKVKLTTEGHNDKIYRYTLEHDQKILSDCDGRLLSIYAWTDCRLPMKYFVYEVEGEQETLVSESKVYVPEAWASPFKFKRDKTYIIRVVQLGQSETEKFQLVKFTMKYRLPSKYRVDGDSDFAGQSFCGNGYDDSKKGYNLNNYWGYLENDWTGVPEVDLGTYRTLPKMTIVATQKQAPHRKFVATDVYRWAFESLYRSKWKEQLADGSFLDNAYAPEGEYSVVANTTCGEIPMDDDYLGRPSIDLSQSEIRSTCEGQFIVTPKGKLTYQGPSEVEIVSFYVEGDNVNTMRNWGESFGTFQSEFTLVVNVKLKKTGKTCTLTWPFSTEKYKLDFDQSQTLSVFCEDSGKGYIHMSLKGGQPPYTYKLLTTAGDEIEEKTSEGAVEFRKGQLGQRFIIKATDNCKRTWIPQEILIQDPAAISSTLDQEVSFCAGDRAVLKARTFPKVNYEWHLPNGTVVPGQELNFLVDKNSGGDYRVDMHLTTCTVTLSGHYNFAVSSIQDGTGILSEKRGCVGESIVVEHGPATGTIEGASADEAITYQWQMTKTPNDMDSWKDIVDARSVNLTFSAEDPDVYYVRRKAKIGSCEVLSPLCKVTVVEGLNVSMTPEERSVVIDHKNPFTLTAGIITGSANRTYQWQRSLDKKTWENVGTEETFTETRRLASTVYYRRNISSEGCNFEGALITVHFKKKYGAYINPQLRQRTYQD